MMNTGKLSVLAGLLMIAAMGNSYAASDAGLIKSAKGMATIERGEQKLEAKPGTKLQVSDRVVTGKDSSVGITLSDGTLLSAGQNSTLSLNKYAFNSTTNSGELDASLKKGTLSVVSGLLSKSSPGAVTYRTPSAILGVRGTEFAIEAGSGGE
jgi:hypothetical protein